MNTHDYTDLASPVATNLPFYFGHIKKKKKNGKEIDSFINPKPVPQMKIPSDMNDLLTFSLTLPSGLGFHVLLALTPHAAKSSVCWLFSMSEGVTGLAGSRGNRVFTGLHIVSSLPWKRTCQLNFFCFSITRALQMFHIQKQHKWRSHTHTQKEIHLQRFVIRITRLEPFSHWM